MSILRKMPCANPLFIALYELICLDLGLPVKGDVEDMERVRELILSGDAFSVKGDKVSLRRWFSWFVAAERYRRIWHRILMALVTLAQASGVYKVFSDAPLWSNFVDITKNWVKKGDEPEADDQAEPGHEAAASAGGDEADDSSDHSERGSDSFEKEVRARGARQAQAAVEKASAFVQKASASNPAPSDDKADTKENAHQTLKELRRQHGNTLLLAGTILSRDRFS